MNWPNRISLLRILLVPLFVISIINNLSFFPLIIFFVCMFTDALDGFIARKFNQKTRVGTFLDPAGDKLLLMSAYLTLSVIGSIPWWLFTVIFMRDVFIVSGWLLLFFLTGSSKVIPRIISKVTTFFQMCTILLVLTNKYAGFLFSAEPLFYITAFITIISGIDYLLSEIKNLNREGTIC